MKMLNGINLLNKTQKNCNVTDSQTVRIDDPAAIHGMVLFGSGPFYVSHLPMYHKPHNYQAILEVEADSESAAALMMSNKSAQRTIVPEMMVLPKVISERGSVRADVYDGHFEKQGKKIGSVQLKIKRVVYFREFDLDSPKRIKTQNYFLFGDSKQVFLAKEIDDKGPDIDKLSSVQNLPSDLQKKIANGDILSVQNDSSSKLYNNLKIDTFYLEKDELK